jgi:DNA-binding MarR family transcriptional regulator
MSVPWPQQSQTLGYLLRTTYQLLQREIYAQLRDAGHPRVREAHSSVLRHLPQGGARMADLAKSAGISKQSIAYLVDDLCQLGYLELHEHPTDRRAKLVRFSEQGRSLLVLLAQLSDQTEKRCAQIVGEQPLSMARNVLATMIGDKNAVKS